VLTADGENQFAQFRKRLYHMYFNNRKDTLMDLLDALCDNYLARSVVELSLNPRFQRDYNSLYKAITEHYPENALLSLAELAAPHLPSPWKGKFWLLGTDVTAYPRPYAFKLTERESVYQPTPIKGQIPVTYGHDFSQINLLVPRSSRYDPSWNIPLHGRRTRRENRKQTTTAQMRSLLENPNLPFYQDPCLILGDSDYSTPGYLAALGDKPKVISLTRSRGNRVYYLAASVEVEPRKRGRPRRRGKKFKLNEPSTWPQPDEAVTFSETSRKGQIHWVEVQSWQNVIMPGKRKPVKLSMDQHPFTLVLITIYNDRHEPIYPKPVWLIVMGAERCQLGLNEIYEAFQYRSGIEQFFRFTKRNLLLDKFQTCETEHEEHWWQIVLLAYLQLWVAREYASCLPRPWEKALPQVREKHLSPTMVQRSFGEIMRQFGTPARYPKPRNKSPGRQPGKVPA
jgi:hypothetical protein